jgi:hypothetical protein
MSLWSGFVNFTDRVDLKSHYILPDKKGSYHFVSVFECSE